MTNSTNTLTQILVQNVETFETVTRLTVDVESGETATQRIDQYFSKNDKWGIVSLDDDADGEYMNVLLVAPVDGPDFMMDMDTGEMEPVEQIDPAAELAAKMDIMMELDNDDEELFSNLTVQDNMNDVPQEDILAMLADEPLAPVPAPVENIIADEAPVATITPEPRKPKAKSDKAAKMRNFEILASFIEARPGVSRTDVFSDAGLQSSLRTPAQVKSIAASDKAEVKRWNRRLNFLIREMRRQGVDVQIERKGRVAHYTVNNSRQLELPFTVVAESRNAAIVGATEEVEELASATPIEVKVDVRRATEPQNISLGFEDLLAQLDEDEATVTSDDQVAFKAAREMLK